MHVQERKSSLTSLKSSLLSSSFPPSCPSSLPPSLPPPPLPPPSLPPSLHPSLSLPLSLPPSLPHLRNCFRSDATSVTFLPSKENTPQWNMASSSWISRFTRVAEPGTRRIPSSFSPFSSRYCIICEEGGGRGEK